MDDRGFDFSSKETTLLLSSFSNKISPLLHAFSQFHFDNKFYILYLYTYICKQIFINFTLIKHSIRGKFSFITDWHKK